MPKPIRARDLKSEVKFTTARSGGPGGQNVNKVNSKVILRFDICNSIFLSAEEKQLLIVKLNRLNNDNELILSCQVSRSQLRNKNLVIEEFYRLLEISLAPVKKRFKTKRTRASIEKRLSMKKQHSQKKANRRMTNY